jgi:DNA repair exonuclease SbcCD ATPase subunit
MKMNVSVLSGQDHTEKRGGTRKKHAPQGRALAVKMKSFRDQLSEIKNSLNSCEKKSLVSEKKDSKKESSANEVKYKICPVCGCKLRFNNFRKHMALQHDIKVD